MSQKVKDELLRTNQINEQVTAEILGQIKLAYQDDAAMSEYLRKQLSTVHDHPLPAVAGELSAFYRLERYVMSLGMIVLQDAFTQWIIDGEIPEPDALEE